jgi:kynurenine formamidase
MTYLGEKGVMTLGVDGASMGPLPDLAAATHQAGGRLGMIWTECATNFGSLPTTGAFYIMLAAKHAGGSGSESRSLAITDPRLAARLIESARKKRVADLSVTLDENYPITWPGYVPGEEGSRYTAKVLNAFYPARGPYFSMTHMLDGHVGTHVILPSFSFPEGTSRVRYADDVQSSLARFETRFGPRGFSSLTLDQAPLHQMMGEARVIDVRKLIGSTRESAWPASPAITLEHVRNYEAATQPIKAGDIVIFYSGYSNAHFKPLPATPAVDRLFAGPLAGKAEGWPAPTPEVIHSLAEQGVRCLGTDGPTIGGVDRENSLFVYWLAASRGMLVVEYLINVESIANRPAFFIFAPIKIAGSRGGYGRALALY